MRLCAINDSFFWTCGIQEYSIFDGKSSKSSLFRQGLTYKLAMNHLTDQSDKELRTLRGRIHDSKLKFNGGQEFNYGKEDLRRYSKDVSLSVFT